ENRAFRKVKSVAMPVQGREPFREFAENRILGSSGGRMNGRPTDLLDLVGINLRAERLGDKLRSQADAEHGLLLGEELVDQLDFGKEERVIGDVVDVHRAAHDDEAFKVTRVPGQAI